MRAHGPLRTTRSAAALAALLAIFAGAAKAAARTTPGTACPGPAPVLEAHPDARHVVLLATATADTVPAGWGDVNTAPGTRRPRGWQRMPVFGQVARAARVAGPGADGLSAGPVVLVPWYPGCGGTYRWSESSVWMHPGAPDVVVGRLRRPEAWVEGVPTVDVLRPDLVKESGLLRGAVRWRSTAEERFGFYATVPTAARLQAEPWGAIEPMRAWLVANAHVRLDPPIRYAARGLHNAANHASVRAVPSPLAGTYRLEVSRTGGPAHTVYVRTEYTPLRALWADDSTRVLPPAMAPGYMLRASYRRSEPSLPSSHPTRPARRVPRGPPTDELEVLLPELPTADGTRRFRAHLGLWNVTHTLFPDDPQLREWIGDWTRHATTNMQVDDPPGEVILRPDGGVELSEVLQLAPGQAVTIRGVRISAVAIETPVDP